MIGIIKNLKIKLNKYFIQESHKFFNYFIKNFQFPIRQQQKGILQKSQNRKNITPILHQFHNHEINEI